MSKPRLQLQAVIDTLAHANTIKDSIRDELVGKNIFEERTLNISPDDLGNIFLNFDFRFNSGVDRDAVKDWILGEVRDHPVVKTWILSAKLFRHECTHEEANHQPCTAEMIYEK